MAKRQYTSMQEELAARRAARDGADPGRATVGRRSSGNSFSAYKGKRSKASIGNGGKTLIARFTKEDSRPKSAKAGQSDFSDDSKAGFADPNKKSELIGKIGIGAIIAILTVIFLILQFESDSTYDSDEYYIDETMTHSEIMDFLEEELYVDWDIDSREIKDWADDNLDALIKGNFDVWETEVSREYILIRTVFEGASSEGFATRCEDVTDEIEDALDEEFDSYPSIVIEARTSPTGDNLKVIDDNEPLTYLCIDGEEYFSYTDY